MLSIKYSRRKAVQSARKPAQQGAGISSPVEEGGAVISRDGDVVKKAQLFFHKGAELKAVKKASQKQFFLKVEADHLSPAEAVARASVFPTDAPSRVLRWPKL